ncbi:hypothetical protein C7G98_10305 [Acinetobacter baumannii]|nr:hypothetical protein C7G98_10305 [Acinetobacter baumannii]
MVASSLVIKPMIMSGMRKTIANMTMNVKTNQSLRFRVNISSVPVLLILMEKTGAADRSQVIQIAERLRLYKKDKLRIATSSVFNSELEFVQGTLLTVTY